MRLFIALAPSPDFKATLVKLQEQLKEAGVEGRYITPSNLHMTLAFIGEWPENVTHLLPVIDRPFTITLSHLSVFPRTKVLWAGVNTSKELDNLAECVRKRLDEAGIPYDRKSFNPHITLTRKPANANEEVLAAIRLAPATMTVHEVCLYQSIHEADGMKYSVIGRSSEAS